MRYSILSSSVYTALIVNVDEDGITPLSCPGTIGFASNAFAVADLAEACPQAAAIFVVVTLS